jgi:anti-sigma factor RsiW
VLDQLSDTDSVVERKSTAKPVSVEGSIRHLSNEDLEAYASGRLTSTRLSACQTHLDSCDACRAELEDIRTLQTELASFSRPETSQHQPDLLRRRRGLPLPLIAAVTAILVAGVTTVVWWRHGSLPARQTSTAALIARSAAAPAEPVALAGAPASPAPATPATSHPAASVASRIPAPAPSAAPATSHTLAASARPVAPTTLAALPAPVANTGFSLLGPFGEATPETRPRFSWQPLPGAIGYKVAIVDLGLHPVQHSPALRATTWRPRRPLAPGHTYLWQVTATLHGGSKVVASAPTPSAALLQITPRHSKRS